MDEIKTTSGYSDNVVCVTDAKGNSYTQAVPCTDGEAFYSVLPDGRIILVALRSKEAQKPRFTLAPAEPSEDEKRLRETLDEYKNYDDFWPERGE